MSGYGSLALVYDRLNTDVDYAAQASYLLALFQRFGQKPRLLLDLACGSGRLCVEMAQRGLEVIGVDGSPEMLSVARQSTPAALPVLYLEQDMPALDLYGTVDGAVCTGDSLNHLCETAQLTEVFRRLSLFVNPGGLLIFDVNTPYKHRCILSDNTFVLEQPGVFCVWRNQFSKRRCEVDMWLDFFLPDEEGRFRRLTDTVRERAYAPATLKRLLRQTGWEILAVFDAGTTAPPRPESERLVFVAKNMRIQENKV